MLEFAEALSEGGEPPRFGDCDDGYVLDLAGGGNDVHELLEVGARLLGRNDFPPGPAGTGRRRGGSWGPARRSGRTRFLPPGERPGSDRRPFRNRGSTCCNPETPGGEDRVSVLFDCANWGTAPSPPTGTRTR